MFIAAKRKEADWIEMHKLEVSTFPLRLIYLNQFGEEERFLYRQDFASYPKDKLDFMIGLIEKLDHLSFKTFLQILKLDLDNSLEKLDLAMVNNSLEN
ncbi:hypothetical protein OROHE_019594 [Orobanche hederae]